MNSDAQKSTPSILVSNSSPKPIYAQVAEQLRTQIISRALPEGLELPSIRALARDLRISVITTKRAYDELESCGFVLTVPGKGTFVAARNEEAFREERLREIEETLAKACSEAKILGLSKGELGGMLDILYEEE
jgi:GntR family transcriptional regulator